MSCSVVAHPDRASRLLDNLVGIRFSLLPLCLASIFLGIQVEAGQQHPSGTLVGTSVVGITLLADRRAEHLVHVLLQVVHYPSIEVGTLYLLWIVGADNFSERRIAVVVEQEIVVQVAQEVYLGGHCGIIARALLEVLVAEAHAKAQTPVEAVETVVGGGEGTIVELCNTFIGPSADGLVGGQFVGIPQQAVEHRETRVAKVQLGAARAVALKHELCIALIKELLSIDSCVLVRVDRRHVEVARARTQTQRQHHGCCGQYLFIFEVHSLYYYIIVV